tara:strand:- start:440 stop:730 length:291 start_codon:yes stop_codon:yes gene_type:complete
MNKIIKVNGIDIWYEEFGKISNETILLIMGANTNCKQWDKEFINNLVSNNFHVIRFDNRDVGKSSWIGDANLPLDHGIAVADGIRFKKNDYGRGRA